MRREFLTVFLVLIMIMFSIPNNVKAFNPKQGLLFNMHNIYLENDTSVIEPYREVGVIVPSGIINNSATVEAGAVGEYFIEQWISPSIPVAVSFTYEYNWLFSLWASGSGNGTLFCGFFIYRDDSEIPLFNTSESLPLNNETHRRLWQYKTLQSISLLRNDRIVFKVYVNASSSGEFTLFFDSMFYKSFLTDPTEIRYMTTSYITVNGLAGDNLRVTPTLGKIASVQANNTVSTLVTGYWGIKVYRRFANGTDTLLSGSTPVAVVSFGIAGATYKSATWACPQTNLSSTDNIYITTWNKIGSGGVWGQMFPPSITGAHLTEQLGAQSLDASTWTVYYNIRIQQLGPPYTYQYLWYFDIYNNEDLIDQITGFKWTPVTVVRTNHDIVWSFLLRTRTYHEILWSFLLNTRGPHDLVWSLLLNSRSSHDIVWSFLLNTPAGLRVAHDIVWSFGLEITSHAFIIIPFIFFGVLGFVFLFLYRRKKEE